MNDFEKLGAFYLGKRYDLESRKRSDDYLLYDSPDLTTHAVIIGMTGSGKTGLGIDLIEEALIDRIPVIAVDPKGDLGNLALQFPKLEPSDFRPWVDPQQASAAGVSIDEFAQQQSKLWSDGLAGWGEDGSRIQRLMNEADVSIYTPGSTAGRQISMLRAFVAPPAPLLADDETFAEQVDTTATGVLALLGMDADPISSKEHILLSSILSDAWRKGKDLDLASLIAAIQTPAFSQIGVMPLDTVFPQKDRIEFAMRLNNLLAAPAFQAWLKGEPLSTANLLYDSSGKPRCSVLSIAHLSDAERMFFVTMLLSDVISWMRAQPGTGSLRAILYIDELFGYMPPVANPPSKKLLLTLLKQARAFGVGVVLSTQNPVDLDYRGLSNTGTWFIGRLQTERDKARVMEGLEGASPGAGAPFDRARMERIIAGLGKRVFLMHSVHESEPIIFETRWTMSYLAGPITRDQIRTLTRSADAPPNAANGEPHSSDSTSSDPMLNDDRLHDRAPAVPAAVMQYFLPTLGSGVATAYRAMVIGMADVSFSSSKYGVAERRRVTLLSAVDDGPIPLDWDLAKKVDLDASALEQSPDAAAGFESPPKAVMKPANYATWTKTFQKWLLANEKFELFESSSQKLASNAGESERDFRIRLQQKAREARDSDVQRLREKYEKEMSGLQEKIRRADQALEREQSQATRARMDSMISIGSAVLGAVFGRRKIGTGTISKVGTAARGMGRAAQQSTDVTRANETVEVLRGRLAECETKLQQDIDGLAGRYDSQQEELDKVVITPRSGDVTVRFVALAWTPVAAVNVAGAAGDAWI